MGIAEMTLTPEKLDELEPGDEIEVLAGRIWHRYTVMDWETPRRDSKGRWLFTARGEHGLGPSPMRVEPDRIRRARGGAA